MAPVWVQFYAHKNPIQSLIHLAPAFLHQVRFCPFRIHSLWTCTARIWDHHLFQIQIPLILSMVWSRGIFLTCGIRIPLVAPSRLCAVSVQYSLCIYCCAHRLCILTFQYRISRCTFHDSRKAILHNIATCLFCRSPYQEHSSQPQLYSTYQRDSGGLSSWTTVGLPLQRSMTWNS